MLAGRMDKKTGAFSANHSYYDSSNTQEYFKSSESLRLYPYFEGYTNQITMYPVFSPSQLNVRIKVFFAIKKNTYQKFINFPLILLNL